MSVVGRFHTSARHDRCEPSHRQAARSPDKSRRHSVRMRRQATPESPYRIRYSKTSMGPAAFTSVPALLSPDEQRPDRPLRGALLEPFEFRGFKGDRRPVAYGSRCGSLSGPAGGRHFDLAAPASGRRRRSGRARAGTFRPGARHRRRGRAGIGWRRDRFDYGVVAGVSFKSPAVAARTERHAIEATCRIARKPVRPWAAIRDPRRRGAQRRDG